MNEPGSIVCEIEPGSVFQPYSIKGLKAEKDAEIAALRAELARVTGLLERLGADR